MHSTCSDTMPPLTSTECREPLSMTHSFEATYHPGPGELEWMNKILEESNQKLKNDIDDILTQATPAMLEGPERLQLYVGTEDMAQVVRDYLAERGHGSIDVVVAAAVPTKRSGHVDYWTPAMAEAKEAAWRAQQPRHQAKFTKSQPSTKARKAARKRAKAGRKAVR